MAEFLKRSEVSKWCNVEFLSLYSLLVPTCTEQSSFGQMLAFTSLEPLSKYENTRHQGGTHPQVRTCTRYIKETIRAVLSVLVEQPVSTQSKRLSFFDFRTTTKDTFTDIFSSSHTACQCF